MRTISYKTWTIVLVGFLSGLVIFNFVIWKLFTEDILTFGKWYNGGLDRMGYIIGSKHYRKPESTLPRKHIENTEYRGQQIDVICVGDSFSNMQFNGRDPLYQDWIASRYGLSVMNIQPLQNRNQLTTLFILLNSGYFDKVKPRYVVFESVERVCLLEFSRPIDFTLSMPLSEIEKYYRTAKYPFNPPKPFFINTGNFKFIFYNLLYRFSDHAFISQVVVRDLSLPFFNVKNDRKLLFFHEDTKHIPLATAENIWKLNQNINALALRLRKKGIKLFFMPAMDKYNAYSEYIVNNSYPKSVFFELLRKELKNYALVDTKAILAEEINKGEKDVYYADDTHWSWKGSKKIVENMRF